MFILRGQIRLLKKDGSVKFLPVLSGTLLKYLFPGDFQSYIPNRWDKNGRHTPDEEKLFSDKVVSGQSVFFSLQMIPARTQCIFKILGIGLLKRNFENKKQIPGDFKSVLMKSEPLPDISFDEISHYGVSGFFRHGNSHSWDPFGISPVTDLKKRSFQSLSSG